MPIITHLDQPRQFCADITNQNQALTFSGTGAHHQNGVAERVIRTVTSWARAMLLHLVINWPEQTNLKIWSFVINQAVYIWNHMTSKNTRLASLEVFASTRFPSYNHLQRSHVWGCPVYVLEPSLHQDNKKIPKWKPRSRRGMYLEYSTQHSSDVGLIMNLQTGYVWPQFHVVYDNLFTTVHNTETGGSFEINKFNPTTWERLIETGLERTLEPERDRFGRIIQIEELSDEWLTGPEI
jgi:hypothetical protein